jgi:drug/metabolite transporter (DMT)-like permease
MQAGATLFCGATAWAVPQRGAPITSADARGVALVVGTALFGAIAAPGAVALALKSTSAASVSLTGNLEPFLATALAWPLYGERWSAYTVAGLATAVGSAALCTAGELEVMPASGPGIAIAMGAAATAALADLSFFGLHHHRSTEVVGAISIIGTAVSGAVSAALAEPWPAASDAGVLVGAGVLAFGLSSTLFLLALPRAGVGRTTLIFGATSLSSGTALACAMGQGTFTPLIAASLAVALLGAGILACERVEHAGPPAYGAPGSPS